MDNSTKPNSELTPQEIDMGKIMIRMLEEFGINQVVSPDRNPPQMIPVF